jgi:hypothetical protein
MEVLAGLALMAPRVVGLVWMPVSVSLISCLVRASYLPYTSVKSDWLIMVRPAGGAWGMIAGLLIKCCKSPGSNHQGSCWDKCAGAFGTGKAAARSGVFMAKTTC